MHAIAAFPVPKVFQGIGYTRAKDSFPLESFDVTVPTPSPSQLLIHVVSSSPNPLDYKLAQLNFLNRQPPVVLGFDIAGVVVQVGSDVRRFSVGDAVIAIADIVADGAWGVGGGYVAVEAQLTVHKRDDMSWSEAGVLPVCFLSAFIGLFEHVRAGQTVYVPGGAGGVGHFAVQVAARALGATVITSCSGADKAELCRSLGATHVLDYRTDDVVKEIQRLTSGAGVDAAFDSTYSEDSFVQSSTCVKPGGVWVVLGVGPGRTDRVNVHYSPVNELLAAKNALHVNANLIHYFDQAEQRGGEHWAFLLQGLQFAQQWYATGKLKPVITREVDGSLANINHELRLQMDRRAGAGKMAFIFRQA